MEDPLPWQQRPDEGRVVLLIPLQENTEGKKEREGGVRQAEMNITLSFIKAAVPFC